MKITVLMENTAARQGLLTEHGLSLYIETGEHKILFDAGQSSGFVVNARKLGVPLAAVDFGVLSHGHYDHGGGFGRFMELNHHAKVYVDRDALLPHYNASGREIGVDTWTWEMDRVCYVEKTLIVAPGIFVIPSREAMPVRENGRVRHDDYLHEQYLMVVEQHKRILFTGCSHRGIVPILQCFQPDVVVGGFHTKDISSDNQLMKLARRLEVFPTMYYTCHCTGSEQYRVLKEQLGEQIHRLRTGDILTL